jgi:hypothetical protein
MAQGSRRAVRVASYGSYESRGAHGAERRTDIGTRPIYAIGLAAVAIIDVIAVSSLSNNPAGPTSQGGGLAVVRSVVWAGIWVTYVRHSRRAAATFVAIPRTE